jgi:anaerobic selenocysteine-containing dehydrogenase
MPGESPRPFDRGRRKFLLSAPALGLGVAACSSSPEPQPAASGSSSPIQPTVIRYDLTRESGALEPDEVVQSACQFCNSLCGIQVLKKSGRVIGIRGDEKDPVAQGGLCVKADMMPQLVYNPRRIKTPLKRVRGKKGDPKSVF